MPEPFVDYGLLRECLPDLFGILDMAEPCGEPFNDALYLVREMLSTEPACRLRAKEISWRRMARQKALTEAYHSAVVEHAESAGHGKLTFADAQVALGREFELLRDVWGEQFKALHRGK